ncbi:MAG: glycoside hydrolase family 30 protein [Bacilli bacterium]|nr:glycoside hydrolase family 30 protein [Bacilli bacterium]MBN2877869.1 glycoside hydrolase family 30 protein [Bacilli bacterium]
MFVHYLTSKNSQLRCEAVKHECQDYQTTIQVNPNQTYQKIIGFGGAFTEAAAYTLSQMDPDQRQTVLDNYFDPVHGLNYTIGRVHINSCDFSLGNYTYVSDNDITLDSFSIAREFKYVIPMILDAQKISGNKISLLASPWSPPAWMKSNKYMNRGGKLLPEYYEVWARYYVKFIEAFQKAGLQIDYLTVQNEPAAVQSWDSCIYTAEEERDFVRDYLGPIVHKNHPDVKILIWDHNRDILVERADTVLKDQEARKHVWGTGVHWYVSEAFENLGTLHELHPDKHILFTEGCIEGGVHLGEWHTGERYARNMIGDFRNYCEGYLDWNLTLNEFGGPNHVGNYCDAPIITDTKQKKIIYNSSYYYMKHFSKFVLPGSKRITSSGDNESLRHVAFKRQDDTIVLVVLNESEEDLSVKIELTEEHKNILIPKRSISTILYRG